REATSVAFDVPLSSHLIGPSWYALVPFEQGSFWIVQDSEGRLLHYDMRCLRGFVYCLFATALFFSIGSLARYGGFALGLMLAAFIFGWLWGMSMLVTLVRVPRLIRKTVRL